MDECESKDDLAGWIRRCIVDYAATPENTLCDTKNEPAWEKPLVGFAAGNDPLWEEIKKDIGPFCWTPAEIFNMSFPERTASPADLTIVSWILPQTEKTKADNRKEKAFPSERWARSRKFGEEFNAKLRVYVVETLKDKGYDAVAPQLSPSFRQEKTDKYGLCSSWSERHAAFLAGLGTFGLCDGLITPLGKAMRCGSVVARLSIRPQERPYRNRNEYCLFYSKGICGKCADRCPAGAISRENGHDKEKCRIYIDEVTSAYVKTHFEIDSYGCGLCQTNVPCESRIPVKG